MNGADKRLIYRLRAERDAAEADADRLAEVLSAFCMCTEYAPGVKCTHHEAHARNVAKRGQR